MFDYKLPVEVFVTGSGFFGLVEIVPDCLIILLLPYSGKVLKEKTLVMDKTFADWLLVLSKDATPPNFMVKILFANNHKTLTFVKVFYLKASCYVS